MDIYQEHILDHAKNPRNLGRILNFSHHERVRNPLCGDDAEIFLDVQKGTLADIKYEIQGCILSRAALSMASDMMNGKKVSALAKLGPADMFKLLGFTPTPSRTKCALFGFEAAKALVEKRKEK